MAEVNKNDLEFTKNLLEIIMDYTLSIGNSKTPQEEVFRLELIFNFVILQHLPVLDIQEWAHLERGNEQADRDYRPQVSRFRFCERYKSV